MTMKYEELRKTLCVSQLEHNGILPTMYMENEIFEEIRKCSVSGSSQVALVYAYYYLSKLLYRYALYGANPDLVNVGTQKEILGYASGYRGLDSIIKKGGVLSKMNYTRHDSNYPISYTLNDDEGFYDIEFIKVKDRMIDDKGNEHGYYLPESIIKQLAPNAKIHYPIKAFERNYNEYENGTFFDVAYTHAIELETFLRCLSNKGLGVEGFYLYCFIKMKSDWKQGFWDCRMDDLPNLCGLKRTKCKELLKVLEEYNFITVKHMPWVIDRPSDVKTKPSSYRANLSNLFFTKKIAIEKQKKITWEQCQSEYSHIIIDSTSMFEDDNVDGEYDFLLSS